MRIGTSNRLWALIVGAVACGPVWSSDGAETQNRGDQGRSDATSAIEGSSDFLSASAEGDDEDDAPKKKKRKSKKEKSGSTKKKKKKKDSTSVAFEYVKANLKEYLQADSVRFLKDGSVKVFFDFSKKNESQEEIFTPKIQTAIRNDFRWTVRGEESYGSYRRRRDGKKAWSNRGLRIGNRGTALLNCWFKDNVVAEIEYLPGVNYNNRQTMALVFQSDKRKKVIGSNFGSQCISLSPGKRPVIKGKPEAVPSNASIEVKLEVKDGVYKASRNGKKRAQAKYKPKDMASGRIGFFWNGGVAGFFPELTITGELDSEKMLKEIRKALKKRK